MLCFCRSEKIEIHFISKSKQLPHAFPGVNTAWTSLAPGESTIAAMNFAEMHIIRSPSRNDIIHWVEWIYKLNCTSVSLCFMGMSTYFLFFEFFFKCNNLEVLGIPKGKRQLESAIFSKLKEVGQLRIYFVAKGQLLWLQETFSQEKIVSSGGTLR